MDVTEDQRRLLALCAVRDRGRSADWCLIARQAQFAEGLDALWSGQVFESSAAARRSAQVLRQGITHPGPFRRHADAEIGAAARTGARLVTVLDAGYPVNLRLIPNLPPFLFYRGTLTHADVYSVAVVGTRDPSRAGAEQAARIARLLTERGVTIVSGLARGIDTVAHRAALDGGGRTIAVAGTGITRCYPAENRDLAEQITQAGAVVSQFWPTSPPGTSTFRRRNVVTSGLSQGTLVVEAGPASGAKMQARLALEHGKKVFLAGSLVAVQQWARDYVAARGAIEISAAGEVTGHLASAERIRTATRRRRQLPMTLM